MSLTCCMKCRSIKRRQPDLYRREAEWLTNCCTEVAEGNRTTPPPRYRQLESTRSTSTVPAKKPKKAHGHTRTMAEGTNTPPASLPGTGEPRLVRSGGMRRDWSFEDLRKTEAGM